MTHIMIGLLVRSGNSVVTLSGRDASNIPINNLPDKAAAKNAARKSGESVTTARAGMSMTIGGDKPVQVQ
jgi:hypothetical protein